MSDNEPKMPVSSDYNELDPLTRSVLASANRKRLDAHGEFPDAIQHPFTGLRQGDEIPQPNAGNVVDANTVAGSKAKGK